MNAAFEPMVWDVITQANEDYAGLYEIVWSFRSNFLPDVPESKVRAAAREAVMTVLERGYARLVWFRVEPPSHPREMTRREIAEVLASPASWRPPRSWEEEFPNLDITEEGERAWLLSAGPRRPYK